jgi:hypothetical protein
MSDQQNAAPAPKQPWTWRAYAGILAGFAALLAVVGWVSSLMKDVNDIADARQKVADLIAPVPVTLALRDVRLTNYEDGRTLPTGDAKIAKVVVVGDKTGTNELRNCVGELGRTGASWLFKPVVFEAPLSYTFPRGSSQLVLAYSFDMGIVFSELRLQGQPPGQTKLQFRVICENIVSQTFDLVGVEK